MRETPQQTALHQALDAPEAFWAEAAEAINWERRWDRVLDRAAPQAPDWFSGGHLNTCYNAVDRHVDAGRGDEQALIFHSAMTGRTQSWSYAELQGEVARVAGGLRRLGVSRGDRVVIYMPMVPEAVFSMLACARIGAVHSVVFGGFAAGELAKRIEDAAPRAVLTATCGLEPGRVVEYLPLVSDALARARHRPDAVIVLQRDASAAAVPAHWRDWNDWLAGAEPAVCQPVAAGDPLYVLYTSGTTGVPKGVVRDNGGHAVALTWSMRRVYDARPGDVFWAASDIGWVVGHSYIVYGPLLSGCTTLLFEGKPIGTPDAGVFWKVIERFGVTTLFTAPTAIRAIRREDPDGELFRFRNLASLRSLFLAGERSDPETLNWAHRHLRVPVVDHWWQTELGWPALARCLGYDEPPVALGSAGRSVPGFDVRVVDGRSRECAVGTSGEIVVRLPLPPGASSALWNEPRGFETSYLANHPGHYMTGDCGYVDEAGCVFVMGRTDDLINVAGHRLSTGAIEEVICTQPAVAECAVIGRRDAVKGQVPLALVVLKSGAGEAPDRVCAAIVAAVREQIGPIASLKHVAVVERLPKTRSGKILRKVLRAIADGSELRVPPTIDDPGVLEAIRCALPEPEPQLMGEQP